MIYITYYNMLALDDVSCYFQLDYLKSRSDKDVEVGDKVLFMMLKSEKGKDDVKAEDIYTVATSGTVEGIGDNWALIRTLYRVDLDTIKSSYKGPVIPETLDSAASRDRIYFLCFHIILALLT